MWLHVGNPTYIAPLTSRRGVLSPPNYTKTNPNFNANPNFANPNCSRKTTKLTSFRRTSPQNHPDDAILANALHHGLFLSISLRRPY